MKQYHDLLRHILKKGRGHHDRTKTGTISAFGYQTRFNLQEGFPIVTTKKVPFRWVAEELFWFLSGDTNEENLRARGVDIWKEWADEEHTSKFGRKPGDLGPVYGYLWRSFGGNYPDFDGFDQIARLMNDLVNNRGSRRHLVSGWDPAQADNVDLPPCHTLWQVKVHDDDYIDLQLYQRSADSFLGVPFNISSYALLLHLIAHVTGYKPGEFIHTFGDLHIYTNHFDQVDELLKREPRPLPRLEIVNADHLIGKGMDGLLGFTWDNIKLVGYDPYEKIEAPVAV